VRRLLALRPEAQWDVVNTVNSGEAGWEQALADVEENAWWYALVPTQRDIWRRVDELHQAVLEAIASEQQASVYRREELLVIFDEEDLGRDADMLDFIRPFREYADETTLTVQGFELPWTVVTYWITAVDHFDRQTFNRPVFQRLRALANCRVAAYRREEELQALRQRLGPWLRDAGDRQAEMGHEYGLRGGFWRVWQQWEDRFVWVDERCCNFSFEDARVMTLPQMGQMFRRDRSNPL